ncbi:MAG: enoyl-CoA hydratase/isomerase family protein [Betaproteobacteria bacterium]|nr:enoyl-CoA hydratase/isomerase family protein [Betaproteobacteria bacterium]MBI2960042.1 enoyl-CoA hydratase/isomerase family protein [Betaproteobacteria bacterium]
MADKTPLSNRREPLFPANELTERIIAERQGPIGWITFNNPERRNAMSVDMWEAIPRVLDRFGADAQVRVIVLTGAGDKAFASGADVSQFEEQRSGAEAVRRYEEITEGAQERLQKSDKPLIAMIRGFCLGGGMNIALACDLRIAAADARFGIPAARMGIGYRVTSTRNLVDTVGAANAHEILLTARQFSAEEAKAMGLVHRVVRPAELDSLVAEYCAMIAANAPLTLRTAKRIIRELVKSPAGFDAAGCAALVKQCFESEDYVEGRRAFMEKRRPKFAGR